jgi:hypothetical protein
MCFCDLTDIPGPSYLKDISETRKDSASRARPSNLLDPNLPRELPNSDSLAIQIRAWAEIFMLRLVQELQVATAAAK